MAAVSTPNLTFTNNLPRPPSPPKGLKKVLSGRRRSSEVQNDNVTPGRRSIDSLGLDRSPTLPSTHSSPSREESHRSSHGGVHKLIPGHNKRQRQRMREAELKAINQESVQRGRTPEPTASPPPGALTNNTSTSSLLTDGSEHDTPPPLVSRDSHTGFFTTSSPLITSKPLSGDQIPIGSKTSLPAMKSVEAFPIIQEPEHHIEWADSATSPKLNLGSTPILPSPTLFDKADTLSVERATGRRGSISKLRAKSPARKIRDVFSRSSKSPRTSPEREAYSPTNMSDINLSEQTSIAERRLADKPNKSIPAPLENAKAAVHASIASPSKPLVHETGLYTPRTSASLESAKTAVQASMSSPSKTLTLETGLYTPKTPPSGRLSAPLTTVTPPTPTDRFTDEIVSSPKFEPDLHQEDGHDAEKVVESNANNLTHRRVRSTSSATHQKSKLSTSMMPPLTPTIEETNRTPAEKSSGARNFTAGSGFFSSWVSAAQNAATSITNLTAQNRSRAGTSSSEPTKTQSADEVENKEIHQEEEEATKKQLAVETLGSGDLDFTQLGLDVSADNKNASLSRPDLSSMRKKSDLQRDEERAKVEDVLAKRAVSAAYEDGGESTPVAELSDPVANIRHAQTFDNATSGTLTPPNGSIFEGEGQPVKRSNSLRSKLANRRSRGSSAATGQSTVVTTAAGSTATLVNTSAGPRATGFTPAPKQRNRAFHQQFRSVPEDDNLIEDYSCALQKEILLAGRIYISEGHICFSSNILGWVTTLIISFEEIVSIERENTAMIIPNAIAIQTLHARHTFRSLLSREATFDLMIGIWKVNHPASFSKSVNGKQMIAEQAQQDAEKALGTKVDEEEVESEESTDDNSDSDGDEGDDDSAPSIVGSSASVAGSEPVEAKNMTRKPSGSNGLLAPAVAGSAPTAAPSETTSGAALTTGVPAVVVDFPGPVSHSPTDCTDSATHYDKVIKDEIIAAPLGKIYSLLYGPQSGAFVRKYLADDCKCLDLVLEDDKKGLTNESKSRQYSYIKPLGGSIGPKQTKCITTENLDFFDLEKSVSVTCTTQTPDVPSGSSFSTKTRYCLSWAPGNATRLQMNCTIEWTAKSWLKGPIEKGANDGQQQYGDGLIKALKGAIGRARGGTTSSKGPRTKRRKKGEKKTKSDSVEQATQGSKDWGMFESVRPILEPVSDVVKPVMKMELIVGILSIMMIVLWFGGRGGVGRHGGQLGASLDRVERLAAYEQLWQREEGELWDWLEERAGVNRVMLGSPASGKTSRSGKQDSNSKRQKMLKDKSMASRLQAEKWSQKEMQEAVRVTRERLEEMQRVLDEKVV